MKGKNKAQVQKKPELLRGARGLLGVIESLQWVGQLRIGGIRATISHETFVKLSPAGNHLKVRYYFGGNVQRFDIETIGGESGESLLPTVVLTIEHYCQRRQIEIIAYEVTDTARVVDEATLSMVSQLPTPTFDAGLQVELDRLQLQVVELKSQLEHERQQSQQRDQLQREMDGIVQELRVNWPTELNTQAPVVQTITWLQHLGEMMEHISLKGSATSARLERVLANMADAERERSIHEEQLAKERFDMDKAHERRTVLLQEVAAAASKSSVETMEASYEALQLVLTAQATLREKIAQVETKLEALKSSAFEYQTSATRLQLLEQGLSNYAYSLILVLELSELLEKAGSYDEAWRQLEVGIDSQKSSKPGIIDEAKLEDLLRQHDPRKKLNRSQRRMLGIRKR